MATNLKQAQDLLFGKDGLRASNFKMFPGHSRDVTAEQIAGEINRVIGEISAGNFDKAEPTEG